MIISMPARTKKIKRERITKKVAKSQADVKSGTPQKSARSELPTTADDP